MQKNEKEIIRSYINTELLSFVSSNCSASTIYHHYGAIDNLIMLWSNLYHKGKFCCACNDFGIPPLHYTSLLVYEETDEYKEILKYVKDSISKRLPDEMSNL